MAKLVAYKMVSPTVTKSVKGALKTSVHSNLDAINNLGKSVNSLSGLTSDLVKISKAFEKTTIEEAIAKRRKVRRKKDSAAEDRQEGKRQGAAEKESSNILKKKKPKLKSKDKEEGLGGFLLKFLGPVAKAVLTVGAAIATYKITEYFSKPENLESIKKFLKQASFVFGGIFKFGQALVGGIFTTIDQIFGENKTLGERIAGLGKALLAFSGIAFAMAAAQKLAAFFAAMGFGDDDGGKNKRQPRKAPDEIDPKTKKKLKPDEVLENGKVRKATPDEIKMKKKGMTSDQIADARKRMDQGEDFATATRKASRGKGFFANIMNKVDDIGVGLAKRGKNLVEGATKGARNFITEQYNKLAPRFQEAFKNVQKIGKKLNAARKGAFSGLKSNLAKAGNWIGGNLSKAGNFLKEQLVMKVLDPLRKFIDPIVQWANKMGKKAYNAIIKTPAGAMMEKYLKTKGLSLAKPGPLGKKIGSKALPIVGGLVNMLFAYDRLASGDVIGGSLESISGALDISGLFGNAAGPPMSMGIDAFMFARDFVPGIQALEEAMLNKVPGFKQLYPKVQEAAKKLPDLGTIVGFMTGNKGKKEEEEKVEVPKEDGTTITNVKQISSKFNLYTDGKAFINGKEVSLEEYTAFKEMSNEEQLRKYGAPNDSKVEFEEKMAGGLFKRNQLKYISPAPRTPEFAEGGLAEQVALGSTMDDIIPIPVILTQLALIDKAVPINKGSRTASISSISSRRL
tara:strand:+ start:819 stop:3029 length:2211 start_codon:yes stop_codon:yes gene_type:complete